MKKNLLLVFLLLQSAFCFSITVTPTGTIVCYDSTRLLTSSGFAGDTLQWQSSPDNITWTDIVGATGITLLTPPITSNTYFRVSKTYFGNVIYSNSAHVELAATPIITGGFNSATTAIVNWTPVGGGSYSISWTGSGTGSAANTTPPMVFTGLTPCSNLNVTVTLTGSMGCPGVNAGTATFFPSPLSLNQIHTNANCGNNDGTITLYVISCNPPYSCLWSTGDTVQNLTNLSPGNYSVTVSDAIGNTQQLSVPILSIVNSALSETHVNANCSASNGSIDITATGMNLPLTYLWSNGATTEDLNNIPAGNYSVTVTDDSLCQALQSVTVGYIPGFTLSQTNQSPNCMLPNGSIDITVSGGTSPFNYLWNNGEISEDLNYLWSGTYRVTVTDAAGCTNASQYISIGMSNYLSTSDTSTNSTCGYADGSIDLTVSGGTAPYNFIWSDGATTEDRSAIISGSYEVSVTDQNGCSGFESILITNNPAIPFTAITSNALCGNANGIIDLTVAGGTAPYNYLWTTGATTEDISNLFSGYYTVTATDQLGCTGHASIYVDDTSTLSFVLASHAIGCTNTGSLYLATISGVPPYNFLWSNGATTDSIVGVMNGYYHLTITDATGCSFTQALNCFFNFSNYVASTAPNCAVPGTASSYPLGGVPPYSYLWSNGQTTQEATGLGIGNYSVTVTDNASCMASGSVAISTITTDNMIKGKLFYDANGNCIYDIGESGIQTYIEFNDPSGNSYFALSDTSGNYSVYVTGQGPYLIEPYNFNYYMCGTYTVCASTTNTAIFSSTCDSSINNFGYLGTAAFDLGLMANCYSANPGFQKQYSIEYYNTSPIPYTGNATIVFTYDSALIYQYSIYPYPLVDTVAHTLTWTVSNVPCGYYSFNSVVCYFLIPASLSPSYILASDFKIFPLSGDCDTSSNHQYYNVPITNSYDPNSKQVSPEGNLSTADSVLTYTIHFQNTGNDTTSFVIVTDTLSPYLNPLTVENIFSSHPITDFTISGTGILKWVFNPVFLVDSASNKTASQGFITFKIKTRKNLPFGTLINNSAAIYFDYNVPVITNTVSSAIINSVSSISENRISVVANPNPMNDVTEIYVNGINGEYDFELKNVLGIKMSELKKINANHFSFKRNSLNPGIYFYSIHQSGNAVSSGKLILE